uniref:cytochrome c biogenesis protein n=1 Tax=Edaphochlamys debaryana TaxID=47281 RepID=UPI0022A7CB20|nr:cytochrome c biogenesis protein [Edaphochlamys debaryana]UZS90743.1 cytochrome c biogenesis protein [Edaphochlamys debaryana]
MFAIQNLDELENFVRNFTFLALFFTTFVYWIYTAFFTSDSLPSIAPLVQDTSPPTADENEKLAIVNPLLQSSLAQGQGVGFAQVGSLQGSGQEGIKSQNSQTNLGAVLSPVGPQRGSLDIHIHPLKGTHYAPRICMIISNILLIILLIVRWEKSGHFPLSNLYESLMFLAWCCTFLYLVYSISFKLSTPHPLKGTHYAPKVEEKILGSLTASSALLMNAFATFSLPKEMQQATPLVPALQSNWLMMHVTVMIISYATLIIGSLLSILYLILTLSYNIRSDLKLPTSVEGKGLASSTTGNNLRLNNLISNPPVLSTVGGWGRGPLGSFLDLLSYRIIGLGFPFLTIGILSGAVWANEAWGSYWSWDPKETWALLTWLVFAIYLHTRLTKGWQGKKPAIIASLGFLVVWFCYLGVNLIGEGLHSYGFFS